MSRVLTIGAAQLGAIQRAEPRSAVVERMIQLLERAHARGCDLVVYPELALTTFFPRYPIDDGEELDSFYERAMPNADTQPLFDRARELGVGFHLGYAELVDDGEDRQRFNTAIVVDKGLTILGRVGATIDRANVFFGPAVRVEHLPANQRLSSRPKVPSPSGTYATA